MKNLIVLLLLPILFCSCSKKAPLDEIGKDPMQDGINLITYSLEYLSENRLDKANKLIRDYLNYYDKKDLNTQILFIEGFSENYWKSQEGNPEFNDKLTRVREIINNNSGIMIELRQLHSSELLQLFYEAVKSSAKVFQPDVVI